MARTFNKYINQTDYSEARHNTYDWDLAIPKSMHLWTLSELIRGEGIRMTKATSIDAIVTQFQTDYRDITDFLIVWTLVYFVTFKWAF